VGPESVTVTAVRGSSRRDHRIVEAVEGREREDAAGAGGLSGEGG
jgi:hypothetical protein